MKDVDSYLKLIKGSNDEEAKNKINTSIEYLFDYVKRLRIDPNNSEDYDMLTGTLKDVFDSELSLYGLNNGDVELEFVNEGDFIGNFSFNRYYDKKKKKYVDGKSTISIKIPDILDYLSYDTYSRLSTCKGVFTTLFHEIEHYKQYKRFTSDFSSPDNLYFVKEFLFSDELSDSNTVSSINRVYASNHDSFMIESDAKKSASSRISDALSYRKERSIEDVSVRDVDYHLADFIVDDNEEKRLYDRDEYLNYKVDNLVLDNLYLLDKFPILRKEYNKDGSKIDMPHLFVNMYRELSEIQKLDIDEDKKNYLINDICNMYYELIFKRLKENNIDEIDDTINVVGSNNFKVILESINEYFRQDRIRKSKLSERKHDIRTKLSSNERYFRNFGNGFIRVETPQGIKLISIKSYIEKYVDDSKLDSKYKDYILGGIPKYGYYLLHNGTKISPNDFINDYLVKELKPGMTRDDIDNICKKYVKSGIDMDYYVELEKINAIYQSKRSVIDNVIEKHLSDERKL